MIFSFESRYYKIVQPILIHERKLTKGWAMKKKEKVVSLFVA